VNPEPTRWDGALLPFAAQDLPTLLAEVAAQRRPVKAITMAEAVLSDGQRLRGVNDLFIGPRSHTSAWYDIALGEQRETQSSSGVIVSTGLGSTAWLKSVLTGSIGVAAALQPGRAPACPTQPWDSAQLTFVVREPFPTRSSQASLVYGTVTAQQPLTLCSRMPEHGVIFSDGMEADFLRFTAGMTATIRVADRRGQLVM
ncbi:MAG TPA: sugar kinase, partial [Aquabacterium sp.]|nr:sugar kinase [Aquabacterium sp.]